MAIVGKRESERAREREGEVEGEGCLENWGARAVVRMRDAKCTRWRV